VSASPQVIYPGMSYRVDSHGKAILELLYEADPEKGGGEKIYVPEASMWMSPWLKREYESMTNKALFRQEYLVDGSATSGAKIFYLDPEATLEDSFPIPEHWTRRMSLDPHPAVRDAMLWVATDPLGDRWYYREYWPSRVGFHYEGKELRGERGPCPEDEAHGSIKDYVGALRYLESDENPENADRGRAFKERIQARVIDYSARAFPAETREGQRQKTFQELYEGHMSGQCECDPRCPPVSTPYFEDAKKDHQVSEEIVNSGLKVITVIGGDGKERKSSRIHIFKDRCPELIYELKENRRQQLTAIQVERIDPTGKPIEVRKHMTDNLRYLEMSGPIYIERTRRASPYEPPEPHIGY